MSSTEQPTQEPTDTMPEHAHLTSREREVLRARALESGRKPAAAALGLSEEGVRSRIRAARDRCGRCRDDAEMIARHRHELDLD